MANPVFTPEELFEMMARERAWMFNPGAGQVIWDEKKGGAAAGGARAGQAVFAFIQLVDRKGQPVELARGEYLSGGDHAEERALHALQRHVPDNADLKGGTMTVLVDQVPCCIHRHNCRGQLRSFAQDKGLELAIWLPVRPAVRGSGSVRPKTAMKTSMQTKVPGWRLERYYPELDVPCCAG